MFRLLESEIALLDGGIRGFRTTKAHNNHYIVNCSPIFMLNLQGTLSSRGIKIPKRGEFLIPGIGHFQIIPDLEQGYTIQCK